MKVKIRNVVDFDTLDSERIILDVVDDTDIGYYMIADSTYTADDKISNKVRHTYWFPDQKVKKGDVVVLYTKKGTNKPKKEKDHTIYFYYWGLDKSIWNDEGDCALLFEIAEWSHKKANQ